MTSRGEPAYFDTALFLHTLSSPKQIYSGLDLFTANALHGLHRAWNSVTQHPHGRLELDRFEVQVRRRPDGSMRGQDPDKLTAFLGHFESLMQVVRRLGLTVRTTCCVRDMHYRHS